MLKRVLLPILLFSLTFLLPHKSYAQSGPCSENQGSCSAINATCNPPLLLNTDGCNDESIPNCADREWICEMPSCTYISAFGTCSNISCGQGQENTYDCSQYNGNEDACNAAGPLVCQDTNRVCEWKGAASCEPAISCGNGTIINPAINDLCHSQNSQTCSTITYDTIGNNEVCIEPDGWYCLPNSGTAYSCAACLGADCDGKELITYAQCGTCNRGGNTPFIYCNKDGVATNDPGPEENPNPLYTAIGCINVSNLTASNQSFIILGLSIGGGLSLLLIAIAGILIKTSAGNPQKLQAGRELLTAAIAGLMLIIFSAFMLRVIGIDILGIRQLGI